MAEGGKPLRYYLGPDLSAGLLNIYRPVRGLLDAVRGDPVGAGLLAAESVGPQADIKGIIDSSQSAMRNYLQGNIGAGLLDTAYIPANLATLVFPLSASGYRKAGEAAADQVLGLMDDIDPSMPARLVNPQMRVFQGGPNKYGPDVPGTKAGLDSSKIGTGEGAQVYGHGHYLAENPEVATTYVPAAWREGDDIAWDGKSALDRYNEAVDAQDYGAASVLERLMLHRSKADITNYLKEGVEEGDKQAVRGMEYLKSLPDEAFAPSAGHLYEYDLPDETIAKMLDWDKPLSEQPETVRNVLSAVAGEMAPREMLESFLNTEFARQMPDVSEVRIARRILQDGDPEEIASWASKQLRDGGSSVNNLLGGKTAGQLFGRLEAKYGRDGASKALREAGIPGIKYLDQGSRGAGEGTRNFVLFDDDAARLMARDDVRFDQGLLSPDLPMDEASRMARAREMGMEGGWYRGDFPDLDTFARQDDASRVKGNLFLSSNKMLAGRYAKTGQPYDMMQPPSSEAEGLYEVMAARGKTLEIDAKGAGWIEVPVPEEMQDVFFGGVGQIDEVAAEAKARGYDSLLVRDVLDQYGDGDQLVIFDPARVRSIKAKFDPAKKDSANILAGVIPGVGVAGLLGAGVYGQQGQQQ